MKRLSLLLATFVLSIQVQAQFQILVPVLLQDLNPGPGDGAQPFQTRYFFAGQEMDDNYEPWSAGVSRLYKYDDLNPDGSSFPLFNNKNCSATSTATGRELWLGFGIDDLIPGTESSNPREYTYGYPILVVAEQAGKGGNHRILYGANRNDLTFTPFNTTLWSAGDMYPISLNNKIFFSADSATTGAAANELWMTNGTGGGTQLLKDINPGTANGSFPQYLTALDTTRFVFTADDGVNGRELYISNGTTAGTQLLKDINPGTAGSDAYGFKLLDNKKIIFFAHDGTHGVEPWITDGTDTGTKMMIDINPGAASSISSSNYVSIYSGANYFVADDGVHGQELWVNYMWSPACNMVMDINPGSAPGVTDLTDLNYDQTEGLLFAADDGVHGREPWLLNWFPNSPFMIADINPGTASSMAEKSNGFSMSDTLIYFVANDGIHGSEVWAMRAVVSVNDIRPSASVISVHPNPTTGMVTVNTNGKTLQADVYNVTGQLLINNALHNGTVNLQNHPDGIYYIRLKDEGRVVSTQKLILAR